MLISLHADELPDVLGGPSNISIHNKSDISQCDDTHHERKIQSLYAPIEKYSFTGNVELSSQAIHNTPDSPIFEEDSYISAPIDSQSSPPVSYTHLDVYKRQQNHR